MDEAPFEFDADIKAQQAAQLCGVALPRSVPAAGRARAAAGEAGIFAGMRVALSGPFDKISGADLESLVKLGGGAVVPPAAPEVAAAGSDVVVVCSCILTPEKERRALEAATPGRLVDQSWLLDSVSVLSRAPLAAFSAAAVAAQGTPGQAPSKGASKLGSAGGGSATKR